MGGESVSAGADLTRLLDDAQPSDEPYRSAWTRYAALRAYLKGAGTSSDVVQATVFTTQKATGVMGALRDAVYAQTATPRPLDLGYLRDHDGLVDVYAGRFESPNFQLGDPPYFDGGGRLKLDDSGKPKVSRMESLRFALTVPRGEMPADGWPLAPASVRSSSMEVAGWTPGRLVGSAAVRSSSSDAAEAGVPEGEIDLLLLGGCIETG